MVFEEPKVEFIELEANNIFTVSQPGVYDCEGEASDDDPFWDEDD